MCDYTNEIGPATWEAIDDSSVGVRLKTILNHVRQNNCPDCLQEAARINQITTEEANRFFPITYAHISWAYLCVGLLWAFIMVGSNHVEPIKLFGLAFIVISTFVLHKWMVFKQREDR